MNKSYILNLFCALSLAVGTPGIVHARFTTPKKQTTAWEMTKEELKHVGETLTAIGTGVLAYKISGTVLGVCASTIASMFHVDMLKALMGEASVRGSVIAVPAIVCGIYSAYLVQKVPKIIMRALGRNYNNGKFNFIMSTSVTLITLIAACMTSKK
jgi:hypothetical protein